MKPLPSPCLRRDFLRTCASVVGAATLVRPAGRAQAAPARKLTPEEIVARVRPARPLMGGLIPGDLARRLGTAHVAGRYHFTDQPFLLEGAERVRALGLGAIKLWLGNVERSYPFNSRWELPPHATFEDIARHRYFATAFALPFAVIALEVMPTRLHPTPGERRDIAHPDADVAVEEQQIYALALHLLRTYRDRDLTFLLQNWEGDWMFRGGTQARWTKDVHPDLAQRVTGFTRWFTARQRGVERARAAAPESRCRVYHAVEVNKVFEGERGVPTLTTHVLPQIRPDLISWSAYDGLQSASRNGDKTAVGVWQGLDLIQHFARTTLTDHEGRPAVYVGEIGFPENTTTPSIAVEMLDGALGTLFARKIPYILHWELYCNERLDGQRHASPGPDPAEALRGFWLVRPDGSLSATGNYFRDLLTYAGGRLPPNRSSSASP